MKTTPAAKPRVITLRTLPKATAQQVFDQSALHLLRQKKKSEEKTSTSITCLYRGPNKTMCAAGVFFSKKEFKPQFNSLDWHSLVVQGDVPQEHENLITALQRVHDGCSPARWKERLQTVADTHGLNTKAIARFR